MLVMTAVLTMPATNTGLLLIDPYITARSFSTPLTLFALASILEQRFTRVVIAMLLTALIHPQMVLYLLFLIGVMWVADRRKHAVLEPIPVIPAIVGVFPTGFQFSRASGAYREALYSRDYFFLYNWTWYHWLGMLAPLAILAWFWRGNVRGTRPGFQRISFALIPFGLLSILAAVVLCFPEFEMFVRLQPLRSFHLITFVFVLLLAGVIGEYFAKSAQMGSRRHLYSACSRNVSGCATDLSEQPSNRDSLANQLQSLGQYTPLDSPKHTHRRRVCR